MSPFVGWLHTTTRRSISGAQQPRTHCATGDAHQSPLLAADDAVGDVDNDRIDDDEPAIVAADSLVVLHACPPDHQGGWGDCRRIGASKTKDTQNSDISASPSSPYK